MSSTDPAIRRADARYGARTEPPAVNRAIDAHVHVWSDGPAAFPFAPLDNLPGPTEGYPAARLGLAMDNADIAHALAIQPRIYGYDHSYLFDAAARSGGRVRVLPLLNPGDPGCAQTAARLRARDTVAGFRVLLHRRHQAGSLLGTAARGLWADLARTGLPIGVLTEPEHLPAIQVLAGRHPSLSVVIDHLGRIMAHEWPLHGPQLLAMADLPNVVVKLSAIGHLSDRPFPYEDMWEPFRTTFEAFGPDRVIWGSDWPHVYETGDYRDARVAVTQAMNGIGPGELHKLMRDNARTIFGFAT